MRDVKLIFAVLLVFFVGCPDSSDDRGENLITNSSFEIGREPSLDGWLLNATGGSTRFSVDAPPSGGRYSFEMDAA